MRKLWIERNDVVVAERNGERREFPQALGDACEWLGVDHDEALEKLDEGKEAVWLAN